MFKKLKNNSNYDLVVANNHTHALTTSENRVIPENDAFTIGPNSTVRFSDFRLPWLLGAFVRSGQQIDLESKGNPLQVRGAFGRAEGDIHVAVATKDKEPVYYYLSANSIRIEVTNDSIMVQSTVNGQFMEGPLTAKNIDKGRYLTIK